VLLLFEGAELVRHALFYSERNANWALQKAIGSSQQKDRYFHHETGGHVSIGEGSAIRLVYLGDPSTKADPLRRSFLNLTADEVADLAEKFSISPTIVEQISDIERTLYENRRARLNVWRRIILPRVLLRFL
jgi:hypothetical protein